MVIGIGYSSSIAKAYETIEKILKDIRSENRFLLTRIVSPVYYVRKSCIKIRNLMK